MLGPKQYLGRSIPERHDLVRVLPERHRKCARETKVREFQWPLMSSRRFCAKSEGEPPPPPTPSAPKGRAN